eukprot:TRINITY_DN7235_c0_g1_i4.p1 TRINITY_DN7235_c0_g1~~TRINITY_DN7235_c0_g1_i4.p1  ORF type:complete len:1068 (-),score=308.25 TRINITY_DN7235_c0_g1_i4:49-3252(-)
MDEFESAVLCSFDPMAAPDIKAKATQYCTNVHNTPTAWRFCLERFFTTNAVQVKFFCLQVIQDVLLHRYLTFPEPDKLFLRSTLLRWLQEWVPAHQPEDSSIRNKYAHTMVMMFRTEYMDSWPGFFHDLLALLPLGTQVLDVFMRILKALDEEVVAAEMHRSAADMAHNTLLKDRMREADIAKLVECWYQILASGFSDTQPVLANQCLHCIKRYTGWIDLALIANDKFVPLFFKFLTLPALRDEACECLFELVNKGMDPLAKLSLIRMLQGMLAIIGAVPATEHPDYMVRLGKLVNLIGSEILLGWDAAIAQGQLERAQAELGLSQLLNDALNLMFRFLNHNNDKVSLSVLGFAAAYIGKLKHIAAQASAAVPPGGAASASSKLDSVQIEHLSVLLQVLRHKMRYPATYDFEDVDEAESHFLDFRKELATLFRNIFRIIPDVVCSFVHSTLAAIAAASSEGKAVPFPETEISLHLFYQLVEAISGTPEDVVKATELFFSQMMMLLASTPALSSHPHQAVQLAFFENMARFARYLPAPSTQPQYMLEVLQAFLDARGIRNPNPAVRHRACHLFRHFVKTLLSQLHPYLPQILESMQPLLVISYDVQKSVPFEDQVNFYEAIGRLIGTNPAVAQQQQHISVLMLPLLAQIDDILGKELYRRDTSDKPYYTTILSQLVTVIGTFSKGFGNNITVAKDPSAAPSPRANGNSSNGNLSVSGNAIMTGNMSPTRAPHMMTGQGMPASPSQSPASAQIRAFFLKALESVMRISSAVPNSIELRERTFFFVHRMVDCVGSSLLPYLPSALPILLPQLPPSLPNSPLPASSSSSSSSFSDNSIGPSNKDLMAFIILVNQLVGKYKESMFMIMNEMFVGIIDRVFRSVSPDVPVTPNSDEQRDLLELQKTYFMFLHMLLGNNLPQVLTSSVNVGRLQQVLGTVLEGCRNSADLQKVCVQVLKRMVEEWGGTGERALPGFNKVIYEQIVPLTFTIITTPPFDPNDSYSNALLTEIVKLHKSIVTKCGPEFLIFMIQSYFPYTLRLPPDVAQNFAAQLEKAPPKAYQDYLKAFLRSKKG